MYRPTYTLAPHTNTDHYTQRWQDAWARLLAPITLWLCVSVSLRYGYYGDTHMVLGPGSSRLFKASSVFVGRVEVIDDDKKGVLLYSFSEKPELSVVTNWTVSNYLIVGSYSRKGFTLWLNKGSRISMRWEAQKRHLNQLEVTMIKGEKQFETLVPASSNGVSLNEPIICKEAEYTIEADDKYYVSVVNTNPRSIIMTMNVNVTSKVHDLTTAKNTCSTSNGSCNLNLRFPTAQYVVITTPSNGDLGGWYIDVSFAARVVTYIAILGFIVIFILLILKYLGVCDGEREMGVADHEAAAAGGDEVNERAPIVLPSKQSSSYGTNEEDDDINVDDSGGSSSSSEELYDAKLCVICYDEQRNCFFVPCGHCATCYDCAQRIMEGESKVCPICRRLIHKVRRLFRS